MKKPKLQIKKKRCMKAWNEAVARDKKKKTTIKWTESVGGAPPWMEVGGVMAR